jgi:hypothetical protein
LPAHWQPLLDLGVPASALQAEVAQLQALPTEDIDARWPGRWPNLAHAVAGPGRRRRGGHGQPARPERPGAAAVQAVDLPGVQLVDRLGELNRVFAATQISAAELKLMSCGLIVLLLICRSALAARCASSPCRCWRRCAAWPASVGWASR